MTSARRPLPRREMPCEEVTPHLVAVAAGEPVAELWVQAHVRGCQRCRDEVVQYRILLRALRRLRSDILEPAPGLLPEVLAAIGAAGERRAVDSLVAGRRLGYVGGLAGAAVGVAVGMGVAVAATALALRSRRGRRGAPVGLGRLAAILPTNRA